MHLTIALPGLFWQDIGDLDYIYNNANLDKFNKILKHSKISTFNYSYSDLVYSSMYKDGTVANNIAEKLGVNKAYQHFLVAEPTHLRLDRDRLLISESELLQLDSESAKSIIDTINSHFAAEIKLYYVNEHMWLMGHNLSLPNTDYYSILDIIGENIDDYLPDIQINKLLNEIQMLLYTSEENKLRNDEGSLTVNSIWVWDKTVKAQMPYQNIYASNIKGMLPIPNPIDTVFDNNNLIIIDNLFYPCYYRDSYGFVDTLNKLNSTLLPSLEKWLKDKNTLDILVPERENTIQLRQGTGFLSGCYRFWENKQLITLVKELHAL
jgi:hypothetical protein